MKRINRAKLRGKPLDNDCMRAYTCTEGPFVRCWGLIDLMYDEACDKCKECGAFVDNDEMLPDLKGE